MTLWEVVICACLFIASFGAGMALRAAYDDVRKRWRWLCTHLYPQRSAVFASL